MRRFFIEASDIQGDTIIFNKEQSHHMGKVLRFSLGEQISACVGDGTLYLAELDSFGKDSVTAKITETLTGLLETEIPVTLYQGMPKADKLELIIQKCTELGITAVVPVETSRSIIHLDSGKAEKKLERWQKIAQEASQQSKRVTVPEIGPYLNWKHFLKQLEEKEDQLTIVLWEDEQTVRLKEVLRNKKENIAAINIIVGPEGGLSEQEVAQLREYGVVSASLGKRILRTETAGLAAVSMILYELDEV